MEILDSRLDGTSRGSIMLRVVNGILDPRKYFSVSAGVKTPICRASRRGWVIVAIHHGALTLDRSTLLDETVKVQLFVLIKRIDVYLAAAVQSRARIHK
jgi:hypothetical protein